MPGVLERIFARSGKRISDYVKLVPLDTNTRVHFWDDTFLESANAAADYLYREAGKGPLADWPYVPSPEGVADGPQAGPGSAGALG